MFELSVVIVWLQKYGFQVAERIGHSAEGIGAVRRQFYHCINREYLARKEKEEVSFKAPLQLQEQTPVNNGCAASRKCPMLYALCALLITLLPCQIPPDQSG